MQPIPLVTVLGKSCVRPATPTKRGRLFLSCLDIFWQHIHCNRRVIFYNPIPQDFSSATESLRRSLSFVLVQFYPWAGRLALGEDGRLGIDCNDLGVEFVEACIDLPISELVKDGFQMKDFFENLCQHLEYKNEHLYTSPLLSVQVTRFSDGGLSVAFAQSHVVADGQSLWHFLVSWAECARGLALSLEPLHERERLAVQDASPEKAFLAVETGPEEGGGGGATYELIEKVETKETIPGEIGTVGTEKLTADVFKPTEHDLNGAYGSGTVENESVTAMEKSMERDRPERVANSRQEEGLVQCLFHMSGESIKKLKVAASASAGNSFSSYVVLCAHFWQRVTIARQSPASEIASFSILVNHRNRLTPPLPPAYFGNAITFTTAHSTSATIAGESLGAIASRIHAAIKVCTEERLRGFMNWLELHDNKLLTRIKPKGRMVTTASSPWFPAYEVDFGWGKPVAVRAVKVGGDGEMVLFGGRPGSYQGDVEFCAAFRPDILRNLLRDEHFLATYVDHPLRLPSSPDSA